MNIEQGWYASKLLVKAQWSIHFELTTLKIYLQINVKRKVFEALNEFCMASYTNLKTVIEDKKVGHQSLLLRQTNLTTMDGKFKENKKQPNP